MKERKSLSSTLLTVFFAIISIIYVMPIFEVVINSFKSNAAVNMETFALPNEETFVGLANYIKGMTFGNYPFLKAIASLLLYFLLYLFCFAHP